MVLFSFLGIKDTLGFSCGQLDENLFPYFARKKLQFFTDTVKYTVSILWIVFFMVILYSASIPSSLWEAAWWEYCGEAVAEALWHFPCLKSPRKDVSFCGLNFPFSEAESCLSLLLTQQSSPSPAMLGAAALDNLSVLKKKAALAVYYVKVLYPLRVTAPALISASVSRRSFWCSITSFLTRKRSWQTQRLWVSPAELSGSGSLLTVSLIAQGNLMSR